jgi:hypothetical protein
LGHVTGRCPRRDVRKTQIIHKTSFTSFEILRKFEKILRRFCEVAIDTNFELNSKVEERRSYGENRTRKRKRKKQESKIKT